MSNKIFILSIISNDKNLTTIFKNFEKKYNSITKTSDNYPHLTFQSGETDDLQKIMQKLEKISSNAAPIKIEIIALTDWSKQWIYYEIKKTKELTKLNRIINGLLKQYCKNLSRDYTPRFWIPHIAIGGKVAKSKFKIAFKEARSKQTKRVYRINNICIVEQTPAGRFKTLCRYKLSK